MCLEFDGQKEDSNRIQKIEKKERSGNQLVLMLNYQSMYLIFVPIIDCKYWTQCKLESFILPLNLKRSMKCLELKV